MEPSSTQSAVMGFAMIAAISGAYFLPSIVAGTRRLKNFGSILILNIFLGWTLVGWVVALCWAASGTAEIDPVSVPAPIQPPPHTWR